MVLRPGSPTWSKMPIPFKKETKSLENVLLTLSCVSPPESALSQGSI